MDQFRAGARKTNQTSDSFLQRLAGAAATDCDPACDRILLHEYEHLWRQLLAAHHSQEAFWIFRSDHYASHLSSVLRRPDRNLADRMVVRPDPRTPLAHRLAHTGSQSRPWTQRHC